MLVTGSYSFLKEKLLELIHSTEKGTRFTFIVHTNQLALYLKEYICEKTGFLANAEFFTPIDISKKATGIEPLQDFEKEAVFRKALYSRGYFLDMLPEEFGLIVQHLKEHQLSYRSLSDFTGNVIDQYESFLTENGYYDREDVHNQLIGKDNLDLQLGILVIFGIKSVPPLYKELFMKLKECSDQCHVFFPVHRDAGYYQNYNHFEDVMVFFKDIGGKEIRETGSDSTIETGKRVYRFDYPSPVKAPAIHIYKALNEYQETEFVAQRIIEAVKKGVPFYKIGVVVPDGEGYSSVIKDVFRKYRIPYYMGEETRYISEEKYQRLYRLLSLKQEEFSKESVLPVLTEKLLNLPDMDTLESTVKKLPPLKGLKDWETYLFRDGQFGSFKNLLESLDFPENSQLEDYLKKLKGVLVFISDRELVEFLENILAELGEKPLYKKLFNSISYREFLGILKGFFLKEKVSEDKKGYNVKVLSPIQAEGNNFSYLFFLGMNSGNYPSTVKQDILVVSEDLGGFDYPFHLLMQQIGTFSGLMDRGKEIYITYSQEGVSSGKKAPSVIIEELKRITGLEEIPDVPVSDGTTLKDFYWKHAKQLWAVDPYLKKIKERWDRISSLSKGNFVYRWVNIKFPIAPTTFTDYTGCPYRYFFLHPVGVGQETLLTRKNIQPQVLGSIIHELLHRFYAALGNRYDERTVRGMLDRLEEEFWKEINPLLEELIPSYRLFEKFRMEQLSERLRRFILQDIQRLKKEGKRVATEYLERNMVDREGVFSGKIDRVDVDTDGRYHVYDYKTGDMPVRQNLNDKEMIKKFLQLVVYRKFLKDEGKEVAGVGILAVSDYKNVYYINDGERLEELTLQVYKYTERLKNREFPPEKDKHCQYCEFLQFCPVDTLKEEELG